jgi:hypothetical protein
VWREWTCHNRKFNRVPIFFRGAQSLQRLHWISSNISSDSTPIFVRGDLNFGTRTGHTHTQSCPHSGWFCNQSGYQPAPSDQTRNQRVGCFCRKPRCESRRKARTDMLEMIRPNSFQHLRFLVWKRPRSQHAATYQMISVIDSYRRSEEALPTGQNLCVYDLGLNLTRLLIYSYSSFLNRSLDCGVNYIYFPNNLSCCLVT